MKPLEQELRLKYDAAALRRLQRQLRGTGEAGEKGFKKADREGRKLGRTLNRLKLAAVSFISSLSFAIALRAVGKLNGELEQMRVAFNVMLGSAKAGGKAIKDIFEFTARTPFQFNEVAQAGRTLLAMGGDAATLREELQLVGDVASGTGQSIAEIAQIFGKIRAKQRITSEEMLQLAERGVPIYEELEKVTGKSGEALQKLVETGKIRFPALVEVFRNLTSEGGKFYRMMDLSSETFLGMISTIKDLGTQEFRNATEPLFQEFKSDLREVRDFMSGVSENERARGILQGVSDALVGMYRAIKNGSAFLIEHRRTIGLILRLYVEWKVATIAVAVASRTLAAAITVARFAMIAYRRSASAARIATQAFKATLASTGVGAFVLAIGAAIEVFYQYVTRSDEASEATNRYRDALDDARTKVSDLNEEEAKLNRDRELRALQEDQRYAASLARQRAEFVAERDKLVKERQRRDKEMVGIVEGARGNQTPISAREKKLRNEIQLLDAQLDELNQGILGRLAMLEAIGNQLNDLKATNTPDPARTGEEAAKKAAEEIPDLVKLMLEQEFGRAVGDFEADLTGLRTQLARGVIGEEEFEAQAEAVAVAFQARLRDMYRQFMTGPLEGVELTEAQLRALNELFVDAFGDTEGVLESFKKEQEEVNDGFDKTITTIRALRSAANGIRQLARSMGILGDELNRVVDGALGAADAVISLAETRKSIGAGELSGAGATASLVSGYVGIAASIASVIAPALRGRDDKQEEIRAAIEENTRRITRSVRELAESMRFGEDVSDNDLALLRGLLGIGEFQRSEGQVFPALNTAADLAGFLDVLGIGSDGLEALIEASFQEANRLIVERGLGNISTAELNRRGQELIDDVYAQIGALTGPVVNRTGGFNLDSVAGVLGRSDFLQRFGGASESEAFSELIDDLGALKNLSSDMQDLVSQLQGVDPTTEAGKERIRSIVEGVARSQDAGTFGFGNLTPSQLEDILAALSGFAGGTGSSEEGFARNVAFDRTITEVQSNALLAMVNTGLLKDEARNQLLRQILAATRGASSYIPGRPGGFTNSSLDFNMTVDVNGNLDDRMIDTVLDQFEQKLRAKQRMFTG